MVCLDARSLRLELTSSDSANTQGLVNGGLAGLFWSYVWTFLGFSLIIMSLAEMASMAPTSGGQYHWVSEFAPPQYQKCLSYLTGWMSTLSWQAGVASGGFLVGTVIQGLITINDSSYEAKPWQGTLLIFAVSFIVFNLNIWCARALPMFQNLLLVLHIFGFTAIIVFLWVVGRVQPATAVFTQFENRGGWNSMGLSLMVGQINAIYVAICSDAAAHMSEEVKDAGIVVPRAIICSYVVNGLMGLILLISYLFCIPSIDDALGDATGYPFLYVFRSSMSTGAVNALTTVVLLLVISSNIDFGTSASRQAYAFARDNGLPFSSWISSVHPKLQVPTYAIGLTSVITIALSLINIGSSTAFNAIISLQLVSLMLTYAVSIGCVLIKRVLHPELLPKARWSLGRFGIVVNAGGLIYAVYAFFWCFWPVSTPVELKTFNWSVLIFVTVAVVSMVMYVFQGRHVYDGPVTLVQHGRMRTMM